MIHLLLSSALVLLVCANIAVFIYFSHRSNKSYQLYLDALHELSKEQRLMMQSLTVMGKRMLGLEQQVYSVATVQQKESADAAQHNYTQAAELMRQGSDIESVMRSCGLSLAEAELMKNLYQPESETASVASVIKAKLQQVAASEIEMETIRGIELEQPEASTQTENKTERKPEKKTEGKTDKKAAGKTKPPKEKAKKTSEKPVKKETLPVAEKIETLAEVPTPAAAQKVVADETTSEVVDVSDMDIELSDAALKAISEAGVSAKKQRADASQKSSEDEGT